MRVCLIVGARPQFIKVAAFSRACEDAGISFYLLHTGQHYDRALSDIFFDELDLPTPDVNLAVGSASHGEQTGKMIAGIEPILAADTNGFDYVVVFGDTNSTVAGAIAATKIDLPVVHVEAGVRSFDRAMPEEINRVVTDRIADYLFCPSAVAVEHLASEGIVKGVYLTGDLMYDSVRRYVSDRSERRVAEGQWALATIHRAENTDDRSRLSQMLACLEAADMPVVWPLHPRTLNRLDVLKLDVPDNVRLMDPVSYINMLDLIRDATLVLTDSGGVQKEAYWLQTPCITLRSSTEWPETIQSGWNTLIDGDASAIAEAVARRPTRVPGNEYGSGNAAFNMVQILAGA